jgi:hypothetical protein
MAQNTHNMRRQTVKFRNETFEVQTVIADGIECLRLKDVQHTCPRVTVFRIDNVQQAFLHDAHGNDLEPLRIKACIGQVVEALEPTGHFNHDTHGILDRIEGKIDRIDANAQEILCQIRQVMMQMYEFTTPRYFFILPAKHCDTALINSVQNWFHTHLKLYFLCECSEEPSKMHVAPHDGYSIKKPKDFVMKYGPYLRTTLGIVQLLLSAGGFVIPQLGNVSTVVNNALPSALKTSKNFDDMKQKLKLVDELINKFDNKRVHAGSSVAELNKSRGAPLQGAELREIGTYLELVDDKRSLGNLYRTVTVDGHVRWVCLEHYDEISFNGKMREYISQFEAMGGRFDQATKEATISKVNVTNKNVKMMCEALTKGFNIVKLIFQQCSFYGSDLSTLLDVVINRSSIRCLNMTSIDVRNRIGISQYICEYMVTEFNNQSFGVRFNDTYQDGNERMLARLLTENKIHRKLHFSACDFFRHETELRRCLESKGMVTELSVEYSNNIDLINNIFTLKTSALHQLQLKHSLRVPSMLYPFCEMLKETKHWSKSI